MDEIMSALGALTQIDRSSNNFSYLGLFVWRYSQVLWRHFSLTFMLSHHDVLDYYNVLINPDFCTALLHRCTSARRCVFVFRWLPSTHEQHWLVLLLMCTIDHIYIQWQVYHQASQHEGRVCQIHLPLSCPDCWFSISGPWGRHFPFLAGVLTPLLALSGALGWGTMLFTAQRALCAGSQHGMAGWAREQPAAHSHARIHRCRHTHTHTSHVTIPGGWQRCLPRYNHYTR